MSQRQKTFQFVYPCKQCGCLVHVDAHVTVDSTHPMFADEPILLTMFAQCDGCDVQRTIDVVDADSPIAFHEHPILPGTKFRG